MTSVIVPYFQEIYDGILIINTELLTLLGTERQVYLSVYTISLTPHILLCDLRPPVL